MVVFQDRKVGLPAVAAMPVPVVPIGSHHLQASKLAVPGFRFSAFRLPHYDDGLPEYLSTQEAV